MIRCKAKYQKLFFIILITACIFIYIYNLKLTKNLTKSGFQINSDECDLDKVNNIIENLCDLYSKKEIIGNLCNTICHERKSYKLVKCYNNYKPKDFQNDLNNLVEQSYDDYKIVLEYEFKNVDDQNSFFKGDSLVILKSRHKYFYDFDQYTYDLEHMKDIDKLVSFLHTYIESTLNHNYKVDVNLKDEKLYLNYLFKLYDNFTFNLYEQAIRTNDIELLRNYILNFLTLLQQDEYLFYKYFQSKQNILQIYGTCGHIYAIERANSLKLELDRLNFNERKQVVLDFLDLVEFYDRYIVESSDNRLAMQICDVKLDNFGLNKRNELKLIDTDMIHLDRMIFNGETCNKNDDCYYFDCKTYCDLGTKHCLEKRVDNNLQVICEKIFFNEYFVEYGLLSGMKLSNTNAKSELDALLKKCISPGYYNNSNVKIGASLDIGKKLQDLISSKEFY